MIGNRTYLSFDSKCLTVLHALRFPFRARGVYCIFARLMAKNFTSKIFFDGKSMLAVILPSLRKDGMHYEVNIQGYPRFYMAWSPSDRYDVVSPEDYNLPYGLILAVSDAIEARTKKR